MMNPEVFKILDHSYQGCRGFFTLKGTGELPGKAITFRLLDFCLQFSFGCTSLSPSYRAEELLGVTADLYFREELKKLMSKR